MKIEYVNPFITASLSVLETVLGAKPVRGELAVQPSSFTSQQISVVCGVTGQVQGQVIYGMAQRTAHQIASTMIGSPVKIFDQLAASAIAELGNMISGNASHQLLDAGYVCDITPPTIIQGTEVAICMLAIPAIVIPLQAPQGDLFITVGLQSKK